MAKLVFSPRSRSKREVFDLTGNLFTIDDEKTESLVEDVHPSIADFVVRTRRKQSGRIDAGSSSPISELDRSAIASPDMLTFISFGSGSSGNCAYLGAAEGGILIDAGVDADTVRDGLRAHGISRHSIKGVILTHDHSDHVKYVYSLVRKRTDLPVFCTPKTLTGLVRRHSISRRIKDYHRPIYKEFAFKIGPFEITPFEVSHDGTDNVGYFIACGNQRMAIATDLGCITPRVDYYMRQANHIMIESNYDARMLATGPYPMHLKARIAADAGHLDNAVTGAFLAGIYTENLRNVFLCHLSQDNNQPDLALETVRNALNAVGITEIGSGDGSLQSRSMKLQLSALPRTEPSQMFTLR